MPKVLPTLIQQALELKQSHQQQAQLRANKELAASILESITRQLDSQVVRISTGHRSR